MLWAWGPCFYKMRDFCLRLAIIARGGVYSPTAGGRVTVWDDA
jgi:hypothetical protein